MNKLIGPASFYGNAPLIDLSTESTQYATISFGSGISPITVGFGTEFFSEPFRIYLSGTFSDQGGNSSEVLTVNLGLVGISFVNTVASNVPSATGVFMEVDFYPAWNTGIPSATLPKIPYAARFVGIDGSLQTASGVFTSAGFYSGPQSVNPSASWWVTAGSPTSPVYFAFNEVGVKNLY